MKPFYLDPSVLCSALVGVIGLLGWRLLYCIATLKSLRSSLIMLPNIQEDKLDQTIQKLLEEHKIQRGEK